MQFCKKNCLSKFRQPLRTKVSHDTDRILPGGNCVSMIEHVWAASAYVSWISWIRMHREREREDAHTRFFDFYTHNSLLLQTEARTVARHFQNWHRWNESRWLFKLRWRKSESPKWNLGSKVAKTSRWLFSNDHTSGGPSKYVSVAKAGQLLHWIDRVPLGVTVKGGLTAQKIGTRIKAWEPRCMAWNHCSNFEPGFSLVVVQACRLQDLFFLFHFAMFTNPVSSETSEGIERQIVYSRNQSNSW